MTTALYRSIHEQPAAIRTLLADWDGPEQAAQRLAQAAKTGRVFLAGIGTSFHAATVGEYLLRLAGVDAWAVRSFEFVHYPRPLRKDDGVIVISHRGSKIHGNMAVERALKADVPTVGITGQQSKMQGPNVIIETVGQEQSSAHSISYTGSLTRLAQIATRLAVIGGLDEQARRIEQGLTRVPALIEDMLSREEAVRQVAEEAAAQRRRFYFVGAGPNAYTGPEGALKAKEASYVTAEGFELEQAIHGPQVAFEAEDLLIPISVPGGAQERMADFLRILREIGSRVWLVGTQPDTTTQTLFDREGWSQFAPGDIADLPEELTPLLTVIPLQLLADYLAAARGVNADGFRADVAAYKRAGEQYRM